jgi:2-keto-3-deoxy-galactonokinase
VEAFNLARSGNAQAARESLHRLPASANDLGLFAEHPGPVAAKATITIWQSGRMIGSRMSEFEAPYIRSPAVIGSASLFSWGASGQTHWSEYAQLGL